MSRKKPYIACVSAKYGSERVIRAAGCIAEDAGVPLEVVTVLSGEVTIEKLETAQYLYEIACEAGAQMTILHNDHPALAVADYVKRSHVTHLIAGTANNAHGKNDFVSLVKAVLPKVNVLLIPPVSTEQTDSMKLTATLVPMQLMSLQMKSC